MSDKACGKREINFYSGISTALTMCKLDVCIESSFLISKGAVHYCSESNAFAKQSILCSVHAWLALAVCFAF